MWSKLDNVTNNNTCVFCNITIANCVECINDTYCTKCSFDSFLDTTSTICISDCNLYDTNSICFSKKKLKKKYKKKF